MTRISSLKPAADNNDRIAVAEAAHKDTQVSMRLSPRATFVLDTMQHRLQLNRTRTVTQLVEAAVLDWVEAQGIDPEGEEFKTKYLAWLTREPYTLEDAMELADNHLARLIEQGEEIMPVVFL